MHARVRPRTLGIAMVCAVSSFALAACQGLPVTTVHREPVSISKARISSADDVTPGTEPTDQQLQNLTPVDPADAKYAANQDLTPAEAEDRSDEIDARYKQGDVLSPEDSEFIRMTAVPSDAVQEAAQGDGSEGANAVALASDVHTELADSKRFTDSGSGGGGGTGRVSGTLSESYDDNPLNITGHWAVSYSSSGNSKIKKIRSAAHFRSYGAAGSKGLIGLVYSADPSDTVAGNSSSFARKGSYTAYQVYFTFEYDATFYTSTGSFNVAN